MVMPDTASARDELGPEDAARAARAVIDTALAAVTPVERDAFWKAIGLYYSTSRHPGAKEPLAEPAG